MENKIQQLTDKLYAEGLQKGKSDAEKMIETAKNDAAKIIADAKAEAERIIVAATTKEEELAVNTRKELVLAGNQMINDVQISVRETVLSATLAEDIKTNFEDSKFVAKLIEQLITAWAKGGVVEVPAAMEGEVNDFLKAKLSEELKSATVIKPSQSLKEGFRVEMEGGHYYINFGKEEFQLFLTDYLRPKVSEIIFEKK